MDHKHLPIALLLMVASLSACQRDDDGPAEPDTSPTPVAIAEFSQLAEGNYWIYKKVQVDSLDNDQGMTYPEDSLFIDGDTIIDGTSWFVQRKGVNGTVTPWVRFLRDSADCLVQRDLGIQFSSENFDEVVQLDSNSSPVQAVIRWSISSATFFTSVPAGDFETYRMMGDVTMYGLPPAPVWKFPRRYWAEGVGKVRHYDFYSSGDLGFRFDLVRYNVQ